MLTDGVSSGGMMADPTRSIEEVEREEHEIERTSHAIYGLIIITSTLVADRLIAEDAITSLLAVWGAGIILLLAHGYAAAVAEAGRRGRWLNHAERHLVVIDNVPLLAALVAPTILLLLSAAGLVALDLALDLAVVISVGALFLVGVIQARKQAAPRVLRLGIGLLGGLIGIVVILLEVYLTH